VPCPRGRPVQARTPAWTVRLPPMVGVARKDRSRKADERWVAWRGPCERHAPCFRARPHRLLVERDGPRTGKNMPSAASHRLITTLSLLGAVGLSTACSSSSTGTSTQVAAGAGGLSGGGGAPATAGIGGGTETSACPDFMGLPVAGPGPGAGCTDGACFSCITPIEGMGFVARRIG
jgi:hypothetical protein